LRSVTNRPEGTFGSLEKGIEFDFLDVHEDDAAADELRSLYTTGKLNFPTILVGTKKLRNPKFKDLDKWLEASMK
jgi:hypothetical protein